MKALIAGALNNKIHYEAPFFLKRLLFNIFLVLLLAVLCGGCASIINVINEPVLINSTPKAYVRIYDNLNRLLYSGVTPLEYTFERAGGYFSSKTYTVVFYRKGYLKDVRLVYGQLNGWFFGNIFFGGIIGMLIVDPLTGGMWDMMPTQLNSVLRRE